MPITGTEAEIGRDFLALMLLLVSAHVCGHLFQTWRMPKVAGEIVGGMLLGPTVLGHVAPELSAAIFHGTQPALAGTYWLGLLLLMFCSGLELAPGFTTGDRSLVLALVVGTTVVPFACGWLAMAWFDFTPAMGPAQNWLALKIVVAVAIAVTSIPIISKIFFDLGIMETRYSKIVLSTAVVHDIILWGVVAVATALVRGEGSWSASVARMGSGFGFVALALAPAARAWPRGVSPWRPPRGYEAATALTLLLALAAAASLLQVNLIFGGLLAGILLTRREGPAMAEVKASVKTFAFAFPIPVYFAITGARLNLARDFDLGLCLGFLAFACVVQGTASIVTMRLLRYDWLSSVNVAVALNDRGGPCIVLATIAYDLGIISEAFFVTLILLAVVTSIMAGSWLSHVVRHGRPLLADA